MNEQPTENKFADELLRQEILELIIQHDPRTALRIYARVLSGKETAEIYERGCVVIEEWGKIVDKILAKAKKQVVKEIEKHLGIEGEGKLDDYLALKEEK